MARKGQTIKCSIAQEGVDKTKHGSIELMCTSLLHVLIPERLNKDNNQKPRSSLGSSTTLGLLHNSRRWETSAVIQMTRCSSRSSITTTPECHLPQHLSQAISPLELG